MNKLGTRTLETERLILRRVTIDDAYDMFNNFANSFNVTRYLTWPAHTSVENSKNYITYLLNKYINDDFYEWVIELKEIKQIIGSIGAARIDDKLDLVHIGYCIGDKWWGKGLTPEAFSRIIKFFFEEVGTNRIEARFDPRNINSGRVMMKCGLKYEGTHRQSDFNNQGICDSSWYAILKEDYKKL